MSDHRPETARPDAHTFCPRCGNVADGLMPVCDVRGRRIMVCAECAVRVRAAVKAERRAA